MSIEQTSTVESCFLWWFKCLWTKIVCEIGEINETADRSDDM